MKIILDECAPDVGYKNLETLPGVDKVFHINEFGWQALGDYALVEHIGAHPYFSDTRISNTVLFITFDSKFVLSAHWTFRMFKYPQICVYPVFDYSKIIREHFPGLKEFSRISRWSGQQKIDLIYFLCDKYWLPELKKYRC